MGMAYGISNKQGKHSLEKPTNPRNTEKSEFAHAASTYGNAEEALKIRSTKYKIITKTPRFGKDTVAQEDVDRLVQSLEVSLQS